MTISITKCNLHRRIDRRTFDPPYGKRMLNLTIFIHNKNAINRKITTTSLLYVSISNIVVAYYATKIYYKQICGKSYGFSTRIIVFRDYARTTSIKFKLFVWKV